MNFESLRKDFPILKRRIHGKKLIYLDSTATSQKPVQVIKALEEFYKNFNSNVQRALYDLSVEATDMHETAREKIAKFINAKYPEEIIFVRNTTEAINLVMQSYAAYKLKGKEIITSIMEHHSNIIPWQFWRKIANGKLDFVDINDNGTLKMSDYEKLVNEKTGLITVAHQSNVLGTINDVEEIAKISHDNDSLFLIDAAQSVPHMPVDVQKIDCDFLACSGHKMLGPMGIGCLYIKKEVQEMMEPFMYGGEMNKEVSMQDAKWSGPPLKWEAGTPDVASAIGLSAAIDYLNKIGMKNVRKHEMQLTKYALEQLEKIKGLKIFGPKDVEVHGGVISFVFEKIHSHDVAEILNSEGIAVRSGRMCAEPLLKRLGVSNVARASFYIYNTEDEIDALVNGLQKVRKVFKVG